MRLEIPQPIEANPHNPATAWAFKTIPDFRLTDLTATEAWEFVKTGDYVATRPHYFCYHNLLYGLHRGRLICHSRWYWCMPAGLDWRPYHKPFLELEALKATDWFVMRKPATEEYRLTAWERFKAKCARLAPELFAKYL